MEKRMENEMETAMIEVLIKGLGLTVYRGLGFRGILFRVQGFGFRVVKLG